MLLKLLAVGTKLPQWIQQGYREYAQRMPRECRLELFEIALGARSATAEKARADECERMLRAIRREDYVIALDVTGKQFDTPKLAQHLQEWMFGGHDVAFCIGGPDGLGAECIDRANLRWSLSPLTFPHSLVRVMVAEQLYRAATILKNHPYHRS